MSINYNKQYSLYSSALEAVRDCVEGEVAVKDKQTIYLKHPDMIDKTSQQAINRYSAYIDGAEFDEFPARTEASWVGRMTSGEHVCELPSGLEYIKEDFNGDGKSLSDAVELIYRDVIEAKFHILVAEMAGLQSTDDISVAELKRLGLKASVKSYERESLIDWAFSRVNGVLQLSYCLFKEQREERAQDGGKSILTSYLELGLDEDGYYYQRKRTVSSDSKLEDAGNMIYPEAGKKKLKWLPVVIIADEPLQAGEIPRGLGLLSPICNISLQLYRMSADYKEAMRYMQPTVFSSGWKQGDQDYFKNLNGRDYIAFGAGVANNLPEGVMVDIKSVGIETQAYERYFEDERKKAKALGAVFPSDTKGTSATEADIDDAENTSSLVSIVRNTEEGIKRAISYCGMFMGLWSPESVEQSLEQIEITLYKDFGKRKMTPEEQRAVRENVVAGMYGRDEGLRILAAGGVTISDAELILDEMEEGGPALPSLINVSQEQELQSVDED